MENLNVVFVGHVDHGKSTTIGRLLYDSESITDDRVEEIQKYAEELKRRFEFAYFLDALEEERREQMTIESTRVFFKGRKRLYTIIDSPGHKEFLKNMLTGASQADAAIVIVSAPDGVEEQTRRHLFLLKLLGIERIVVAINKMDAVGYREEVYNNVRKELEGFLQSLGFDLNTVAFVPISALEGDNVYKRSEKMPWTNTTLIECLDAIKVESKKYDRPLRFVVQDVYERNGKKIIVGRVESGILRAGMLGVLYPEKREVIVKEIMTYEGLKEQAEPGECVGVRVTAPAKRGDVLAPRELPPRIARRIKGETILLTDQLKTNEKVVVKCGTAAVEATVTGIEEKIDTETGEITEHNPTAIGINEAAMLELSLARPMALELYSFLPELGRFLIVKNGRNIGAGVVMEVYE
jgi:translation elongation factor TU